MFKSLVLTGLLSTGLGAFSNPVNPYIENVAYNDENFEITLSSNEVSTYVFDNFYSWLSAAYTADGDNMPDVYIDYNNSNYEPNDYIQSGLSGFQWSDTDFITLTSENKRFINLVHSDDSNGNTDFNGDFVLMCETTIYEQVKSSIELDIQANQPSNEPRELPVLLELVSLLVGAIVPFASGLGAGVSSLVTNIFVSNSALSVMGAMVCIFGGIALAIGLSRWVMNFLTSLGAKK